MPKISGSDLALFRVTIKRKLRMKKVKFRNKESTRSLANKFRKIR